MIIQQLSVFLENKSGRLHEILETLGTEKINIIACSIADSSEYGILRLIVSDPEKARNILKQKLFSVNINEVLTISTPNRPGGLAKALAILSDEGISIEYLYAFGTGEKSFVVLRTDDTENALKAFQKHVTELIKASDLYKL